jgi:hypothetical protein
MFGILPTILGLLPVIIYAVRSPARVFIRIALRGRQRNANKTKLDSIAWTLRNHNVITLHTLVMSYTGNKMLESGICAERRVENHYDATLLEIISSKDFLAIDTYAREDAANDGLNARNRTVMPGSLKEFVVGSGHGRHEKD